MINPPHRLLLLAGLFSTLAFGQSASVLSDLASQNPVTLTKDELSQLLPDASMSRVTGDGRTQVWKNDPNGTFVISSGQTTTASAKWHISDDGRYCVQIEWKRAPTEDWCRFILKAGDAYYATKSDKTATERVHKLQISK